MRSRKVKQKSIARAVCRSMNGRAKSPIPPRRAPQLVRKVNQGREQSRVFELAQQCLVLFGQAGLAAFRACSEAP